MPILSSCHQRTKLANSFGKQQYFNSPISAVYILYLGLLLVFHFIHYNDYRILTLKITTIVDKISLFTAILTVGIYMNNALKYSSVSLLLSSCYRLPRMRTYKFLYYNCQLGQLVLWIRISIISTVTKIGSPLSKLPIVVYLVITSV